MNGAFDEAVSIMNEMELQFVAYGDKINKEQEVLFNYNKAYSYFGDGQFKKALASLNLVLNDNEQNLRQDIYSFARIFNLILHYELGNYDFLEYSIKSTNRYLNKQERTLELESTLVKYLRKLSKMIPAEDKAQYFVELKAEIEELLKDENEK